MTRSADSGQRRWGTVGMFAAAAAAVSMAGALVHSAHGQELAPLPPATRPYDEREASLDAYHAGEARRREAIDRQLNAIQTMRWWRGLPPRGGVVIVAPPGLAFDVPFSWGYAPAWVAPRDVDVRQPIGQVQVQTGPYRWESRPVYEEPLVLPVPQAPSRASGPREF